MTEKAETAIVTRILKWIQKRGGRAYHVHGSMLQAQGEPDIDGYIPYKWGYAHLKLEVKTPEGEPSALQLVKLRKYHMAGYVAGIVTSVDEVEILIAISEEEIQAGLYGNPTSFGLLYKSLGHIDKYKLYS